MTRPRLLIVEDTDFNRDLLVQIFEEAYEIDTAGEAASAVEAATTRRPDVILMDIRLPGFSGLDAARAIRQHLPDVPIVAVTSQVMPGDEERAVAAGCDAFVAKPIDDVRLVELVERLLRAR
jgi:two-component system, cell cycle response regulator DivK